MEYEKKISERNFVVFVAERLFIRDIEPILFLIFFFYVPKMYLDLLCKFLSYVVKLYSVGSIVSGASSRENGKK